jgi:hypothetical protein
MLNLTHHSSILRAAGLMVFTATTLAVASLLHLATGDGGGAGSSGRGAGIAEATICLVLLVGALALVRDRRHGRAAAFAASAFAILGFLVGLTFTLRSGELADVIYHLAMLPVLGATVVLLLGAPHRMRRLLD